MRPTLAWLSPEWPISYAFPLRVALHALSSVVSKETNVPGCEEHS